MNTSPEQFVNELKRFVQTDERMDEYDASDFEYDTQERKKFVVVDATFESHPHDFNDFRNFALRYDYVSVEAGDDYIIFQQEGRAKSTAKRRYGR